jgi:hypothetical protein
MSDNTVMPAGVGGDTIRDIDRAGVKTQVNQLDVGGAASESLLVRGQQAMSASLPVVLSSNQSAIPINTNDGTGAAINSLSAGTGANGLIIAMGATNFVVSTTNSTVVQLTAGATFTGGIETIFNEQDISILLTNDQAGTLTLKQYIDAGGTRVASSWVYAIAANVPFSRSFVGNGNYFNATFQNNGASTTTTLNLNVAYGTLGSATNLGNAPVSLNEVNGAALALGQTTMAASVPVVLASNQTAIPVSVADTTATTTISAVNANYANPATVAPTAASTLALSGLNSSGSVKVTVNGVANSITLQPQVTLDGSTWWNLSGSSCLYTTGIFAGTVTLNGLWDIAIPACVGFRLTCTALFAGNTATVVMRASSASQTFSSPNVVAYLATGTNSIGTVQQATITKATQGTTGVTTQDLKDAGRVNIAITCYQAAGIITTEALFAAAAFSISRDGATATTGQQFSVTAGKRFRIQSIIVSVKNTAAAAGTSKLALRYLGAGGTITNTSPILSIMDLGSNSAVANNYIGPTEIALPDGIELIAGSTFGFTSLCGAVTMLHTITINGYEY